MSDWQPQVVEITKSYKHPGADALSMVITSIGDYPIITRLDEYKPGDLACYIPIDSIVPDTEQYHFLCPRKYIDMEDAEKKIVKVPIGPKYEVGNVPEHNRIIKAKRIRGEYSQGMLVPLPKLDLVRVYCNGKLTDHLKERTDPVARDLGTTILLREDVGVVFSVICYYHGSEVMVEVLPYLFKAGDSVAAILNLTKWEEEEEENTPRTKKGKGQQESPPKGWSIPHYDIDGMRKHTIAIEPGELIVMTEKIHGANAGFCFDGEKLWCKSRNFYKKPIVSWTDGEGVFHTKEADDQWWDIAHRYDLEEKLKQFPGLVFFGEVYGNVKGFRYDCEIVGGTLNTRVRFFDIWDTKTMKYLDYPKYKEICESLCLDMTPELYRGPWIGKEHAYPFAEGKTTLGGLHIREGFVLRPETERFSERMNGRLQMKLVGEGYNLQK